MPISMIMGMTLDGRNNMSEVDILYLICFMIEDKSKDIYIGDIDIYRCIEE